MSKDINITQIKDDVMALGLGRELDEAVAKEVYKLIDTGVVKPVTNPVDGQPAGESTWTTNDGVPVRLPMFSTVPFIGCLMLEDINKEVIIIRTNEGTYRVAFDGEEGSGVTFECKHFSEAIARAILFEGRYKELIVQAISEAIQEPDEPSNN